MVNANEIGYGLALQLDRLLMASASDPTVLQIDGFTMRPLRASDLDALAAIWAAPEVTRFLAALSMAAALTMIDYGRSNFTARS
jgi:hypothetical protein